MESVGKIFSCANLREALNSLLVARSSKLLLFFLFYCVSQSIETKIVSEINDPGKNDFQNK